MAVLGGDTLEEAISRLEDVLEALPAPKDFPRGSKKRDLAKAIAELGKTALADLRALRDREA